MARSYTKVTRTGWGSRIFNSFIGALIGLLLFFGSFVVLWMNEGRTDWSAVARGSVPLSADQVDPSASGKFVAVSGPLAAAEPLGDAPYLRPGPYVELERIVEMYAWKENEKSETRDEIGGGSTTTTTYTYEQEWTTSPEDSSRFEVPAGHENPPLPIEGRTVTAAQASVGAYAIDAAAMELPSGKAVPLSAEVVTLAPGQRLAGGYIYDGEGSPDKPRVGDVRISYRAVNTGTQVTAFGRLEGAQLTPYMHQGDQRFYRALAGSRDEAISALRTEYVVLGWVLRLVGFLMMWIGLSLFLSPISAFLHVLPFLGNASGFMIGLFTFVVAAVLTVVTVLISILAHNLLALIVVLLLFAGGVYLWDRSRRPAAVAQHG